MLKKLMNNIPQYLNHFLFEILDEYTIGIMENGIKRYLKELKVDKYDLKTIILDRTNLRINLNYDDKMLTFFVARS